MSEDGLKILTGTIEEPENEYYEDVDVHEDAFKKYDLINFLDSIGTSEFKNIYMMLSTVNFTPVEKTILARDVVERIKEVYDIDLILSDTPTLKETTDIFKFLKFIEFEYINFMADVWKFLKVNLRSDIRDFCIQNSDKIIKIIEEQIETHFLPELVVNFLRTYNKEDMINLFIKLTEKSRMMIVLRKEGGI